MKCRLIIVAFLSFLVSSCTDQPSAPIDTGQILVSPATLTPQAQVSPDHDIGFKITTAIETKQGSLTAYTYFLDDFAVEMDPESNEADTIFDLQKMTWTSVEKGKTVRFTACENWVNASISLSKSSIASLDDSVEKRLAEALVNPKFEVTSSKNGDLLLENEFYTIQISPTQPLSTSLLDRFYQYDRLSACKKAMDMRQLPLTQYAITEETKSRNIFPGEIDLTFRTPKNVIHLRTTNNIEELTDSERNRVHSLISK